MRVNGQWRSAMPAKGAPKPEPRAAEPAATLAGDRVALGVPLPDAALVRRALAGGEVRFRNDQGGEATLSLDDLGEGRYRLRLDGRAIEVEIDAGLPAEEALARIADYQSQLPPHMREGLERVEVTNRQKEGAAATAYGGKRVVFWEGMRYLRPNVYFHELGHINARRVYGHTDPSDAWDRAEAKDGKHITDYAGTSDTEDFAEMTEAYWMARRGEGDWTLDNLRARFPERTKIVEAIVENRPIDTRDSDYWVVAAKNIPKPATIWRQIDGPAILRSAGEFLRRLNPFD